MTYLKPTISDAEVYSIVHDKIINKIPFCLTRFGDGEIYFINDNVPEFLQQKVCKLWNYRWPNDFRKVQQEVTGIIKRGLDGSDMIGLLDPNHEICKTLKYDPSKWSIRTNQINNPNVIVCDHQITRNPLFGDIHSFKKLLNGTSINIISPNTDQLKNNHIDTLLDVEVSYTHINNDRQKMLDDIRNIKEDVVLFGASIYGKDLGVFLKAYRKVALDFGATLDGWAGLVTRPWFNDGNLQQHCLIKP